MCAGKKKKRKKMINPGCMLRRTEGMTQSPCYALVLPLSMDAALMIAMFDCYSLLKGRGNSGKMTHNVPGLAAAPPEIE